ncbi:hypothetical protein C1J03_21685 [Sulfitobacter sp. SK012]|uniref:hypothetical protein n=1 Tax=Sulfitobacter sp. SK012 TaxID=1389005 RepID=UPI000E0BC117|nr:hypothetical protein [Sulfitobacter sp. SK012]AXI48374.1 hypothetical protein C1J03_21685 [Sulfitobacter sp. SK012]
MLKRSLSLFIALSAPVFADPPRIDNVTAHRQGGLYTFDVTISHTDTGWDDYVDGWRIVSLDGTILGERTLAHPHVNEQPFTRSLSGVKVPTGTEQVRIQARDNVNGWYDSFVGVRLR